MVDIAVRHYTPAEAAVLSGIGVKAVHNAIDKRIIEVVDQATVRKTPRALSSENVLYLKIWYEVGAILSQELRIRLFDEIRRRPSAKQVKAGELLIVNVGEARKQIASRARDLEAAEAVVTQSSTVMGGEPVFKGTRIPVRLIALMLDDGATENEILDGYPKLEARHLGLARIWAAAHPRRGRPKSLADRGRAVRSQSRSPLKGDPGPAVSKSHRSS